MSAEEKVDYSKAVKSLEQYQQVYNFMAVCSQIHTNFTMLYRTMNQNFPLPTKAWRYSPEYDMEKKIFEAEALFEVYYNVLESAKDNNEWVKKVELDLGKHMSFLYGIFPRPVIEKHAVDLPFMKKFVFYLY
jgi:hypothetical protein